MSLMEKHYSTAFFAAQRSESIRSAEHVASYLTEVLAPQSVLDVGCGAGGWVRAFESAGASTAHGVDGPWARESGLLIPENDFSEYDFINSKAPFSPEGLMDRYDLVTTFEVVEHLPDAIAPALADFFTSKSDAVIIGCAIPGQGGSHHINEQWPSYWAALMHERGYQPCDFIRPAIWDDEGIMPWYKQNSIGYFKGSAPQHVTLRAKLEWERRISEPLALVHPGLFAGKCRDASPNLSNVIGMADRVARNAVKKVLGRQ